ncbi:MAG: IclR family transcriptional regulator [Burkholderiaceae bacterium]
MAGPKVLEILQLFTVNAPRWRVERIADQMQVSTSTAYRCVAELVRVGFLQPVSGGAYVLGPAFTEFDLRMRLSDPLLRAAGPHMRRLHEVLGPQTTTVLARYYRDCVMFAHIERGRDAPSSHGRGQQISLFSRAAMARAVLFALPDRLLRALYQTHAAEIAASGLGDDQREFRGRIKALRECGWTSAKSVVVPGRVGIGAPVVCDGIVRGSMGVSLPEPLEDSEVERVGLIVMRQADLVGAELSRDAPDVPRLLGRRPRMSSEQICATLQ